MAATLRINGRDYSSFLKLFTEDQVGVVDAERITPQFAGNAAVSEGQVWISSSVANKHWQINMIVRGASLTVDSVNQMVRDIRGDLYRGATVEYAPDGASNTTFFELEAGEFRPNYNHPRYRHGHLEGVLELWTRPYGNTGTTRLLASGVGTGVFEFPATGVLGDTPALANLLTRSNKPDGFVVWGVHPCASARFLWPAASFVSPSLAGASGAIASQYHTVAVASPGFYQVAQVASLPDGQTGRFRLLAVARHGYSAPVAISAHNDGARATSGVATLTATAMWEVADLGEVNFAAAAAGEPGVVPPLSLSMYETIPSGASQVASPGLKLNAMVLVPLDTSVGMISAGDGNALTEASTFVEFRSHPNTRVLTWAAGLATGFGADMAAYFRGGPPRIPAVGSPGASGPARVMVMAGTKRDFVGNALIDAQLRVRDRFTFFR